MWFLHLHNFSASMILALYMIPSPLWFLPHWFCLWFYSQFVISWDIFQVLKYMAKCLHSFSVISSLCESPSLLFVPVCDFFPCQPDTDIPTVEMDEGAKLLADSLSVFTICSLEGVQTAKQLEPSVSAERKMEDADNHLLIFDTTFLTSSLVSCWFSGGNVSVVYF